MQKLYLTDILVEGMADDLVRALRSENTELLINAAHAIFKVRINHSDRESIAKVNTVSNNDDCIKRSVP